MWLHDAGQPELYAVCQGSRIPLSVKLWKGPLKWLGNIAMVASDWFVRALTCGMARRNVKRKRRNRTRERKP